jgi:hypothetical protein
MTRIILLSSPAAQQRAIAGGITKAGSNVLRNVGNKLKQIATERRNASRHLRCALPRQFVTEHRAVKDEPMHQPLGRQERLRKRAPLVPVVIACPI